MWVLENAGRHLNRTRQEGTFFCLEGQMNKVAVPATPTEQRRLPKGPSNSIFDRFPQEPRTERRFSGWKQCVAPVLLVEPQDMPFRIHRIQKEAHSLLNLVCVQQILLVENSRNGAERRPSFRNLSRTAHKQARVDIFRLVGQRIGFSEEWF